MWSPVSTSPAPFNSNPPTKSSSSSLDQPYSFVILGITCIRLPMYVSPACFCPFAHSPSSSETASTLRRKGSIAMPHHFAHTREHIGLDNPSPSDMATTSSLLNLRWPLYRIRTAPLFPSFENPISAFSGGLTSGRKPRRNRRRGRRRRPTAPTSASYQHEQRALGPSLIIIFRADIRGGGCLWGPT